MLLWNKRLVDYIYPVESTLLQTTEMRLVLLAASNAKLHSYVLCTWI